MSSSIGLPLDFILEMLDKNDMVIDWVDFIEESKRHKWKTSTLLNRIETSLGDIYDEKKKKDIMDRILFYLEYTK